MASGEQRRRTVIVGGDPANIEVTPTGLVAVNMPKRREAVGTHDEIEQLIAQLRAALDTAKGGR